MARYWPEPSSRPCAQSAIGIMLVNLGTPGAPTAAAVRPYLRQFLSDPRVVEIPRALWWPILNSIVLTVRPKKSAEKYASIWSDEGSPLQVHTAKQAKLLASRLGDAGVTVDWAMRYGSPSIRQVLDRLKARGCARILVVPLYPQYAASTTASAIDEVAACLTHWRNIPEIRFVRDFHDHPGYIAALAQSVRDHWARHGQANKLVMSFHGVPRRSVELGDPYRDECGKTAQLLAEKLRLPPERWQLTFQSRFGTTEWLKPYTQPTLEALAREGVDRIDVMCPGFPGDCLETLEEIAMECRSAFLRAGGKSFHYIPCLNERADWLDALAAIVRGHILDWLEASRPESGAAPAPARTAGVER